MSSPRRWSRTSRPTPGRPAPRAAIADDFLPALRTADPATTILLLREMRMLGQLRAALPQAEVALSGHVDDLTPTRPSSP